jgi:hypothetical protein
MARESPDIPHSMRKVFRRFERWRSAHTARLPIPERFTSVGGGGGGGPRARGFPHRVGSALGVWQGEAADGISPSGGEVSSPIAGGS